MLKPRWALALVMLGSLYPGLAALAQSLVPGRPYALVGGVFGDTAGIENGSAGELFVHDLAARSAIGRRELGDASLVFGIDYRMTRLDFDRVAVADRVLHALAVPITYLRRQGDWQYVARLAPGLATDFDGINSSDFTTSGLFRASRRTSEFTEWVVGAGVSRAFGDSTLYPLVGAVLTPNQHWRLALTLPRLEIGYAPSARLGLFANLYPAGGKWHVHADAPDSDFDVTFQAVRLELGAEYHLSAGRWIELALGSETGRSVELVDDSQIAVDFDLEDSSYLMLSLLFRAPE